MYRQCNNVKEMGRRLLFLFYILGHAVFMIACVVALARKGLPEIIMAMTLFWITVFIRSVGYRYFDFKRLSDSFPSGCPMDLVPEPVRAEVEGLVDEFYASTTDWARRVEIRHRLIELEEEQPAIIAAYEEDLKRVLAA